MLLAPFCEYFEKARMMQHIKYEWNKDEYYEKNVNCDLIWNVPIYDVVHRKYAAFSSFTEAVLNPKHDPKDNSKFYRKVHGRLTGWESICLLYLFRLCGSGINYKPKVGDDPQGSHGFGNFWIDDLLRDGIIDVDKWVDEMPKKSFSDNKGYMLPMISYGLRNFIIHDVRNFLDYMYDIVFMGDEINTIQNIVEKGNGWLMSRNVRRQNFVLSAFAADLAEYFPDYVDPNSMIKLGTNAKKCAKIIKDGTRMNDEMLMARLLAVTGNINKPMDMEDVMCDFIRWINNFQSQHHIEANNGNIFKRTKTEYEIYKQVDLSNK